MSQDTVICRATMISFHNLERGDNPLGSNAKSYWIIPNFATQFPDVLIIFRGLNAYMVKTSCTLEKLQYYTVSCCCCFRAAMHRFCSLEATPNKISYRTCQLEDSMSLLLPNPRSNSPVPEPCRAPTSQPLPLGTLSPL